MSNNPFTEQAFLTCLLHRALPALLKEAASLLADDEDAIWLQTVAQLLGRLDPRAGDTTALLADYDRTVRRRLAVPDRYEDLRPVYAEPFWLLVRMLEADGTLWHTCQAMLYTCLDSVVDSQAHRSYRRGDSQIDVLYGLQNTMDQLAIKLAAELGLH